MPKRLDLMLPVSGLQISDYDRFPEPSFMLLRKLQFESVPGSYTMMSDGKVQPAYSKMKERCPVAVHRYEYELALLFPKDPGLNGSRVHVHDLAALCR